MQVFRGLHFFVVRRLSEANRVQHDGLVFVVEKKGLVILNLFQDLPIIKAKKH